VYTLTCSGYRYSEAARQILATRALKRETDTALQDAEEEMNKLIDQVKLEKKKISPQGLNAAAAAQNGPHDSLKAQNGNHSVLCLEFFYWRYSDPSIKTLKNMSQIIKLIILYVIINICYTLYRGNKEGTQ
jgi:hypothetical protein